MHKIASILLLLLAGVNSAKAQPLEAEDAVAYLLGGVQVSKTTILAGIELTWTRKSAGHFVGIGQDVDKPVQMNMDVRKVNGCVYETKGNVVVDGKIAASVPIATFDFTKIISLDLLQPKMVGIDATEQFCASEDPNMCGSFIDLAVATDAATYRQVYTDFRRSNCP